MTEHHNTAEDRRPVLVIRRLDSVGIAAALCFRILARRVIYMEPAPRFRSPRWETLFAAAGLEFVDLHTYPGYEVNADLMAAISYTENAFSMMFTDGDIRLVAEDFQTPRSSYSKARALVAHELRESLLPHCRSYAVAECFKARGITADVFEPMGRAAPFLRHKDVTRIRNFHHLPSLEGVRFALRTAVKLASRHILKRRSAEAAVASVPVQDDGTAADRPLSGEVLYFAHKGIRYGDLYIKDHYYSNDPTSPFYRDNIVHIELGWRLTRDESAHLSKDYRSMGIDAVFAQLPRLSPRAFLAAFIRFLRLRGGIRTAIARAVFLARLVTFYQRARSAFGKFTGARLALIDSDMLFPPIAVVALQANGIAVAAAQTRFMTSFLPFAPPLFDLYLVHGDFVRRRLDAQPYASPGEIRVIGDFQVEKIVYQREGAVARRQREFPGFAKMCLVFDFHSPTDKYANALAYGVDWASNGYFYSAIIRLAEKNPDCLFVIRGKDASWLGLPPLADQARAIERMSNVVVDRIYERMDRTYELAAMCDLVIGRYTSAADHCIAAGIPALIFEGMPNGNNQLIAMWHDFSPYPVFVRDEETLHQRFDDVIRRGAYMAPEMFAELRRDYFHADDPLLKEGSRARLHAALMCLYRQTQAAVH